MATKAIVAARVTAEKKQRFAIMAHNRGLSESSLLNKLIDGVLTIAPPVGPVVSQDVPQLPVTGKGLSSFETGRPVALAGARKRAGIADRYVCLTSCAGPFAIAYSASDRGICGPQAQPAGGGRHWPESESDCPCAE